MTNPVKHTTVLGIEDVGITFLTPQGGIEALRNVEFDVHAGEFLTIVGRSGSGKSTLLSAIAGLRPPTTGVIRFNGIAIDGPSPEIGYVTQQDNLLPWRTVEGNLGLPLELHGVSAAARRERIAEMIEIIGLQGFERRRPIELSGGMRKRVTLGRTLIYKPRLLLLDEPFGSLDAQLKAVLQGELLKIWAESNCTFVFVTHDLEEAVLLGDRVVLLGSRPGHVRAIENVTLGRPRDLDAIRFSPDFQRIYSSLLTQLRAVEPDAEAI